MQLDGYALALVHGVWFIGKMSDDGMMLQPAYEAHVRWMGDGNGNFGILRECVPIAGSTKLDNVGIDGMQVWGCDEMTGKEREAWANAIREAEDLIKALRTAESGLVLPPTQPSIIK